MTVLEITLTIAGAAALLSFWIASRVSSLRRRHKVLIGDGGNEALAARMRAHSNFAEYTPIFLILLGLVELARGSSVWLWAAGAVFIVGRILHVFGMDRPALNRFRVAGMMLTALPLLCLALYAVFIPYEERAHVRSISYADAPPAPARTWSATNGLARRS